MFLQVSRRSYDDFLLQFICQKAPKLILVTLAPFGPSGGSLGSLLFLAGLGTLFHSFGRCPKHDDFLLHFIRKSVPKLVLVTLAPFGSFCGDLV